MTVAVHEKVHDRAGHQHRVAQDKADMRTMGDQQITTRHAQCNRQQKAPCMQPEHEALSHFESHTR